MSGSADPRMCEACGERPKCGASSSCYPCIRERLEAAIEQKNRERGRPLTSLEKLNNLQRWLDGEPPEALGKQSADELGDRP